ncbi:hypothetical protein G6M26_11465 [Agrobacterium tumefaciens]|nr:hypothetical protein [Agrobacterium tumefaciens]NTE19141.1 hypothetical protein [Agrobacterium tumefaciens]
MSKTYETGNAKNVANFETLITYLTSFGSIYNPSNASISLTSLNDKAKVARAVTEQVNRIMGANSSSIADRAQAFEPLSKLSTRIFNALKASNVTSATVENAATNHRKLQGRRATAKLTDAEKQQMAASGTIVKQISASQQSFDSKLDSLEKQIYLLSTSPQYNPNENDLRLDTLTKLHKDLLQLNNNVILINAELGNARINRDNVLYNQADGMVTLALNAKDYSKSIFGTTTPQYKQISGISFKNVKI